MVIETGRSIVDELAKAFPEDVPDLKEATDHLAPLNLPAQIGLYFPGREGRLGVQVRISELSWLVRSLTRLWNRIHPKPQLSAQSAIASEIGWRLTFRFNGASV